MRVVLYVVFGIYIAVLALEDILKKSIPVSLLLVGILFIPAGIFILGKEGFSFSDNALGLIPGAVLLLISYVSRGQIGIADAVLVTLIGAALGIEVVVKVVTAALLLITVFSAIMLILGKLKRKSILPFIPFLLAGYLMSFF